MRSAASGASEQEIDAVREQRLGPADDPILLLLTDLSAFLQVPRRTSSDAGPDRIQSLHVPAPDCCDGQQFIRSRGGALTRCFCAWRHLCSTSALSRQSFRFHLVFDAAEVSQTGIWQIPRTKAESLGSFYWQLRTANSAGPLTRAPNTKGG